jgi:hypothetical protein
MIATGFCLGLKADTMRSDRDVRSPLKEELADGPATRLFAERFGVHALETPAADHTTSVTGCMSMANVSRNFDVMM